MEKMTDAIYIKRKKLAELLSVTPRTIQRWEEKGLPVIRINGAAPMYDFTQVKKWIEENNTEEQA